MLCAGRVLLENENQVNKFELKRGGRGRATKTQLPEGRKRGLLKEIVRTSEMFSASSCKTKYGQTGAMNSLQGFPCLTWPGSSKRLLRPTSGPRRQSNLPERARWPGTRDISAAKVWVHVPTGQQTSQWALSCRDKIRDQILPKYFSVIWSPLEPRKW